MSDRKVLKSEGEHSWESIDSGLYDSVCKCSKCGLEQMWSVDNPETELPKYGCN